MDKDSAIVTVRGMIAQNPKDVTFTPSGGSAQTVECGESNLDGDSRQLAIGLNPGYRLTLWSIKDDWNVLPKEDNILEMDGTEYRVLDWRDYYMGVARRFDVGAKYETGSD